MNSILLIDDDERLLFLISTLLRQNAYDVRTAISAADGRKLLMQETFDIVLVDWMMPNESGIEFVKSVRNSAEHISDIPIIMLTALSDIDNKVESFETGADDYIAKPFEEKELIARIKALIKRTSKQTAKQILHFGDCVFDIDTDTLQKSGENVSLSSTELSLLKTLCKRPNQPLSRVELAKKLSFQVSDRTIDVQITRLRKKIGDNSKQPEIIQTIRHIGYMIKCRL